MSDFLKKLNNLEKAMRVIPAKMGAEAVRFSKERFQQQNWVDSTSQTWKPRKKQKGSKQRNKRGVLTDSGRLRRSIRKTRSTRNAIYIGTDVPYAQIHNDGGKVNANQTVRAHTRGPYKRNGRTVRAHAVSAFSRKVNFTMPRRRFLGNSQFLGKRIVRIAQAEIERALR